MTKIAEVHQKQMKMFLNWYLYLHFETNRRAHKEEFIELVLLKTQCTQKLTYEWGK